MLRIALLGCGRIGVMHAANIASHKRAELAGVFDIRAEAAQAVAAAEGVRTFASPEEIFADKAVDAVLIATSTPTHADLLEQAVAAGKPVLCEKPIDLSLDRVNRAAAKIAGSSVPVMLGFVRRFDPGHRACRTAIKDGSIGDLHQVVVTSRDPGLAPVGYLKESGGIFRDMTIHDFDMARFLLGEEVATVSATASRLVDPKLMADLGDYDTLAVTMATASGKQAVLLNSRRATYGYDQRVEVFGSGGMAVSENRRPHATTLHSKDFTDRRAPLLDFFIERYAEAFSAEIGSFVDAVDAGRAPEVGFEDGRMALVLAEAAMRSVKDGRSVMVSEVA